MKQSILPRKFATAEVQQSFTKVVGFYDFWSQLTESKAAGRALQIAQIHDGEAILEVAVGTGIVFEAIVQQNPHGRNEGVDLSPDMLSRAKKRVQAYPESNHQLQEGSAYSLPFADGSFDLIVSNYMFDLLPEGDFVTILTEFGRVLKPAGRVVITMFSFGTHRYNRFWLWAARHFPSLLTGCRPIGLDNYVPETLFHEIEVEEISQNTFPSAILSMKKRAAD